MIDLAHGGVGLRHVTKGKFENTEIPLPPYNEQRRIVAKLDSLFERTRRAREELSHIPRLIENYKKAILEAAFQDATDRSDDTVTLGNIASEVRNGLSKKPHDVPPGTPILRISSVRSLKVHLNNRRYYPVTEEIANNTYLRNGDLLYTRYNGNPKLVAVCGQVRGLSEPLVYPDKLIRVRICNDDISQDYIEIICAAKQSRQWLAPHIKTAAGQHGISGKDLKGLPIPLPKRPRSGSNCLSYPRCHAGYRKCRFRTPASRAPR